MKKDKDKQTFYLQTWIVKYAIIISNNLYENE